MKKTILIILSLVISLAAYAQKGDYRIILTKVECQGKTTGDSSTIKIDSTNKFNFHYLYSDKVIDFIIYRGVTEFYFDLKNNSDQTIKILWDEAAYINPSGETSKVFHTGVKYIDRNNSQPATSIIKGAKVSDIIAPTSNIYYSSGSYGGWRQQSLLEKPKKHTMPQYDNSNIRILIPLSINGSTVEYIFTLRVKWMEEVKNKKE